MRSSLDLSFRKPLQTLPLLISLLAVPVLGVAAAGSGSSADGAAVSFVDVAAEAGLTHPNVWGGVKKKKYIIEAKGSGLAFLDYNRDGWPDIYVSNGVRFGEDYSAGEAPTTHLYRNDRNGTFTDVSVEAGIARTGWQTGVCVGDYDNDGWEDLFAGFWGHNVLFRNQGDGSFRDVTENAGLLDPSVRWASGCTWLDFDRDGQLDLFVANYMKLDLDSVPAPGEEETCVWKGVPVLCGPQGLPGGDNILYRNRGNGTFEDVSERAEILVGSTYSITPVAHDFNNDGWPDLYVAVDSDASLLFLNRRDGTFEEAGMIAGCAFSEDGQDQAGMGVGVADFNRDGWLDIFKTNFQHDTCNLYQNNGDGTFRDMAMLAGIGRSSRYVNWGAGFLDFDNDGWKDIFYATGHVYPEAEAQGVADLKTPRALYRNLGDGKFEDLSSAAGPGLRQKYASRGCAFGDYDNDGDIDVVVLNMNDPPSLLRNDGGNAGNWIQLKLIGTSSNRSAIGARVKVVAGGTAQIDEVHSGTSVMSQSDLRLHFGLGRSKRVDRIEVNWPGGLTEKFENLEANRFFTILEGKGRAEIAEFERRSAEGM